MLVMSTTCVGPNKKKLLIMRKKIALKKEIDRLINELILKNKNDIWLNDRVSESYQYNNLLTTIQEYLSRWL